MYQDSPSATAKPAPLAEEALRMLVARHFPTAAALAASLDHTLLKPEATEAQVVALASQAAEHRFACAMVNPVWVPLAARVLAGSGVRVGTVLGFPLGASLPATKQAEAVHAARAGARDLDMVIDVGGLCSGLFEKVREDIRGVAQAAHGEGALLKVIVEACLLDEAQKRIAAELCAEAGAEFVKTSTGFSTGGATEADVRLLRHTVGDRCGVKAAGGIRSLADAARMAEAGANRIGASASVAILAEYRTLAAG